MEAQQIYIKQYTWKAIIFIYLFIYRWQEMFKTVDKKATLERAEITFQY